jgi:hypothetical protein
VYGVEKLGGRCLRTSPYSYPILQGRYSQSYTPGYTPCRRSQYTSTYCFQRTSIQTLASDGKFIHHNFNEAQPADATLLTNTAHSITSHTRLSPCIAIAKPTSYLVTHQPIPPTLPRSIQRQTCIRAIPQSHIPQPRSRSPDSRRIARPLSVCAFAGLIPARNG